MTEYIYSVILPWFVSACLITALCIGIGKMVILLSRIRRYPLYVVIVLFLLLFIGAWIRFSWVPDGHRILFDEDRYLSFAVSFAKFGKTTSLDFATPGQSIIGVPDHAIRVTVPVLHGWILRLFGDTETILFRFSRIMSSIQIFLIFAAAYLLFGSFLIAIWSALGIALLPVSVYWSVSLTLDNYFVFFCLLGLISASLYAKKNTLVNGVFFLCSLFLLLCVRFEGVLFLPILLGVIGYIRFKRKKTRIQKIDVLFAVLTLIFIGIRGLLSFSVLTKTWCCAESMPLETFSIQYVVRNILPNIISFFGQKEFPFIITLLALFTLFYIPDFLIWLMGAWILLFFFLYSTYYAGMFFTYEFSGSYGRYFLIFIIPLLFLSGMALEYCWNIIQKPKTHRLPWIIGIILSLTTLFP
ncbi:glycosyltransferase family 39 protein, partial [Patescibacteria group bacterium]|nr:glycosyltransferase family 39 protein [Patescibacteria group bacterium]